MPRVVIIDDEKDQCDVFSMLLRDRFSVFFYTSPNDAFADLSRLMPDLILADIAMPDCDGIEFLRRLRS